MRAAVLYEAKAPLAVEEVELSDPQQDEILVQVAAVGVCHSDYHYMTGDLATPMPVVLGHEGAGIVEAIGPGVTRVKPGDKVVLLWRPSCGSCEHCARGRPALCAISRVQRASGGMLDGTSRLRKGETELKHFLGVSCLAERCVVAEQAAVRIPDDTPMEIAALLGCSIITGVGAVLNTAGVRAGSSVLVIGAGGVGLCCVMGAAVAGASQIVVADVAPEKLELARDLGATDVIQAGREDVVKTAKRITGGGADYSFEAIGNPETLVQVIRAIRAGGTAVAVGLTPAEATVSVSVNDLVLQEKTVKGSLYGSSVPVIDIPMLLRLYLAGQLPLDRFLGRTYSLNEVNEAYGALVGGQPGRALILPTAQ